RSVVVPLSVGMDASCAGNDAVQIDRRLLPDTPFSTLYGTKLCTVGAAFQSTILLALLPRRSRDIPMKSSPATVATALLLASLAAVAKQPIAPLPGDKRPDSGAMTADVYTNNFFGFSYRVPTQWTGRAIQRSQPGGQRFYQLLSALP